MAALRLAAGLSFLALTAASYWAAAAPAGERGWRYLLVHGLLSLFMLAAWQLAERLRLTWRWLLVVGLASRLVLVGVAPFTTHDLDRYLWDGRVALEGLDPYRVAPDDPRVAHLRSEWRAWPEQERFPTLYPPLAIGLFAVCAAFGASAAFWLWKLVAAVASMAIVLLAWRSAGERSRNLILVALNPLLLLEAGVGAHLDVVAAALMLAGYLAFSRHRELLAGVLLGLAALCKPLPILLVLPLALALPRRNALHLAAGAAAIVACGYGVLLLRGWDLFGSLHEFSALWRFGSPLGALLAPRLPQTLYTPLAVGAAAVGIALLLLRAWRNRPQAPLPPLLIAVLALPLWLSPVVFPWYLLPLAALLHLAPRPWLLAWLLLAPATYEVLDRFDAGEGWQPAVWPLWLIAVAVALALLGPWTVTRRRSSW